MITRQQFAQLADGNYNRIPLIREVLADMDTPLSAYRKLADEPYTYLFESVQGGEQWGRYSIIGLATHNILRVTGNQLTIERNGTVIKQETTDDPLTAVELYQRQFRVPTIAGMPRFSGGLVGYFGYDCIRYIEKRLATPSKQDLLRCPDLLLLVSDQLVVFDNFLGKLYLIVHAEPTQDRAYESAWQALDRLVDKLTRSVVEPSSVKPRKIDAKDFTSAFTKVAYHQAVNKIKDYIVAGDAMQVVLSRHLSIPFRAPPLNLYRALRLLNPSPYMFYLNLNDFHIVGSSPEILVRLEDGMVTVRPIAGTRPRGANADEDLKLEQALLRDPKERAEHLMLIDLARNDAGRVSATGSVKVTDKMIVERYSHVMHIVSNVTGRLKQNRTAMDVLRAVFPAGTVSGAPKIRAMEIIDELESVKRGVYAGAVGYLDWCGNMDTAIAIRTAIIKNGQLHTQAGGGIVADSIPENEWQETLNKSRALFKAAAMAENGLHLE